MDLTLLLGIDTGGTYTDGVLLDAQEQVVVAKGKALTTYDDLAVGIRRCIETLINGRAAAIGGVSLSTTLATNAIVEGRGCDVGVLLIGQALEGDTPAKHTEILQGGHDVKGVGQAELDPAAVDAAVERLRGKVDAVAISGYFSVRNPEHELAVREIVHAKLQVPVVCAHQLTTSLGFRDRTVTAVLNAKLIPVIVHLLESVKIVMKELNIDAPLMIVKGDGTLMGEAVAREKPIDTILSGPAASIIGAITLAKRTEAVVVDMGGTTTDIAILQNGQPRINPEGAVVGDWFTRVEAAEVYTYGIGGDSYLRVDDDGELLLGPQKAWPLSRMVMEYPYLAAEIREQVHWKGVGRNFQPTDCYQHVRKNLPQSLTPLQEEVLELLNEGPHSFLFIYERLKTRGMMVIQSLVEQGLLSKISMTPTDILHAAGRYAIWDTSAACLGVEILADKAASSPDQFVSNAITDVVNRLCHAIIKSLLLHDGYPVTSVRSWKQLVQDKALTTGLDDILHFRTTLKYPIVALGAPVGSYFPAVAEKLGAELIIPEHSEVANAVGAASGHITENIKILIRSEAGGSVVLHGPWGRCIFPSISSAREFALAAGSRWVEEAAGRAGAENISVVTTTEEFNIKPADCSEAEFHVETRIKIVAVGRPNWRR